MPGFAPFGAVPLASAGVAASRAATVRGTLALVGRSVGGSTAQTASVQAALVLVGQARNEVGAQGIAGTTLSLGGEARASTGISAAASGGLNTGLDALASVIGVVQSLGAIALAGDQRAKLGATGGSAMLLQITPQSRAALAIDVAADNDAARALSLTGSGRLQVPAQALGVGEFELAGATRLALTISSDANDLLPATGAGQAVAAVNLTANAAFGIDAQASGIALQARAGSLRSEINLLGLAAGHLALVADLALQVVPKGTGLVQLPVVGAAQAAFNVARAVTADLPVSAATHRVLPLTGAATARQVLVARAAGAVILSGRIASTAASSAAVSTSFAAGLAAAAQTSDAAEAQSRLALDAKATVSAPIGLTAAGHVHVSRQITGAVLANAQTRPAALTLDGQARARLQAAAIAEVALATVTASVGQVGLQGESDLRADVVSDVYARTALRADLTRPVLFDGVTFAAAVATGETHQAALAISCQSRASLALSAHTGGAITVGRDSLGTVAIDAAAIPALGLTLTVRAITKAKGAASTAIPLPGDCAASAALIASATSVAQLGGASLALVAHTPRAGSAIALAGVGRGGVTHSAVARDDLKIMDACIGTVVAIGDAAPLFAATGQMAMTSAILGQAAQGAVPVALFTQITAALDAMAGDELAVRGDATAHLPLDSQGSGLLFTTGAGSADIAAAGQTVCIFALPGQAHAGVGTEAQLQSVLAANLFTTAVTSIELRLTGTALDPQGTAQSRTAIDARLSEGRWSSTAVVQGYRAPPGLGRSTAPNAAQGGSVVTVLRSGSVLSGPRSGRILQG
jgi:hypothetical protein